MLDLKELLDIARDGNELKWNNALTYLKSYEGEDDELLGAKSYLEDHGFSKRALLDFANDIESASLIRLPVKKSLIRIPAWSMAAAASVILTAGLYFNNHVQQKSLHVVENPLPVYLSDDEAVFNKAMSLYKKGEYEKAAWLFRTVDTDTACYYLAVSYEMLRYFNLSREAFNRITPGSEFYNKARIRLAAISIDTGKKQEAEQIISRLKPANEEETERLRSVKVRLQ